MKFVTLLALAGCYRPADVASCAVSCDQAHACPSGLECDGALCHAPGETCGGDAGTDSAPYCFTPSMLPQICVPTPLRPGLLQTQFINTSDATSCDVTVARGSLSELCVIAAERIEISTRLVATGSRALVLVASESFDIAGTLDVSSYSGESPGAGGTKKCNVASAGAMETSVTSGAGGGAGGTFGTQGGKGGTNGGTTLGGGPSSVQPFVFDAGQNGGVGGNRLTGGGGGGCGLGGGAVYLYTPGAVAITGQVLAFASAGTGATDFNAGGGGGGAGGAIVIDSVGYVSTSATVLGATGAGGGAGATMASAGDSGFPPTVPTITQSAQGGSAPVHGGNGATGAMSRGGNEATPGMNGVGTGGGGGGGGAGVILLPIGVTSLGTIYPPAN